MRWRKCPKEIPTVSFDVETDWGYRYRKSVPLIFVDKKGRIREGRYEKDPQRQSCFMWSNCIFEISEVDYWLPQSELLATIPKGEIHE
jgi:hypothetical protein